MNTDKGFSSRDIIWDSAFIFFSSFFSSFSSDHLLFKERTSPQLFLHSANFQDLKKPQLIVCRVHSFMERVNPQMLIATKLLDLEYSVLHTYNRKHTQVSVLFQSDGEDQNISAC